MGILDDVANAVDKGTSAVSRTTKSAQLKMQVSDLNKRRREVAAQLGAALYEKTRNDATFREENEELYSAIEQIDAQCETLNTQIKSLEAPVPAPMPVVTMGAPELKCPNCGEDIYAEDVFCCGCGTSVEEIKAAIQKQNSNDDSQEETHESYANKWCPTCGAEVSPNANFCKHCGGKL